MRRLTSAVGIPVPPALARQPEAKVGEDVNDITNESGWMEVINSHEQAKKPLSGPSVAVVTREEMEAAVPLITERADSERQFLMMETDRVRQELAAPLRPKISRLENENLYLKARIAALGRERR